MPQGVKLMRSTTLSAAVAAFEPRIVVRMNPNPAQSERVVQNRMKAKVLDSYD